MWYLGDWAPEMTLNHFDSWASCSLGRKPSVDEFIIVGNGYVQYRAGAFSLLNNSIRKVRWGQILSGKCFILACSPAQDFDPCPRWVSYLLPVLGHTPIHGCFHTPWHVHVYIYICIFVYVYELVMYDTQLVVPTVDTLPLRYTYYVVLMAIYV